MAIASFLGWWWVGLWALVLIDTVTFRVGMAETPIGIAIGIPLGYGVREIIHRFTERRETLPPLPSPKRRS